MSVFFGYTGDGEFLPQMANKLRHWKPDREGVYKDENISLGCLEWDNVDVGGRTPQPIRYKHFVIVGDTRLDNRPDIMLRLRLDSKVTFTDLELVVRLYEIKGKDTPRYLIGDFAFLIWDSLEERVFAARDQLGIKVLYFALIEGKLIVGSEIKGMLAYPGVDVRFHTEFLVRSFTRSDLPHGQTLYDGVKVLPPATYLEFCTGKLETYLYWELGDHQVLIPESHEERLKVFKQLFYQAVKDRLRTPGHVGAELSGGLDSTGIAAAANDLLGVEVPLFTYSFAKPESSELPGPKTDDNEIVREFCESRGLLPYWTKVNERDFDERLFLELNSEVLDEFDDNGVPLLTGTFLKKAQKQKVKVMLSGWGGDQGVTMTVGGLYRPMAMHRQYRALWKDIRRKHGLIPSFVKWVFFSVKYRSSIDLKATYNKISEKFILGNPLLDELINWFVADITDSKILEIKTATDIKSYLKLYLKNPDLERRVIHHGLIGRHFGVEYRFPMLDVRLLEYIYALPLETLTYQGKSRYLFTTTMASSLPVQVIAKRKSKVPTVPFFKAYQQKVLPYLEQKVRELYPNEPMEDFFSPTKVQDLIKNSEPKKFLHLSNLFFIMLKRKNTSN
jgi:asparagine synthase (glutamine-hydrolysing)